MKVRKYLLICIAAIALNALTACGGGSTQSDPLDPENPENPEPPAYFNPIEGEWLLGTNDHIKFIFTNDYKWQRSYLEKNEWTTYETLRTYKMINERSFRVGEELIYYFRIESKDSRETLIITYPNGEEFLYSRI